MVNTVPKKRNEIGEKKLKGPSNKRRISHSDAAEQVDKEGKIHASGRIMVDEDLVKELFQLIVSDIFGMDMIGYDKCPNTGRFRISAVPAGTPNYLKMIRYVLNREIGIVESREHIPPAEAFKRHRKIKKFVSRVKTSV